MTRAELIEWASTIGKYEHTVWVGKDTSIKDVKLAVQEATRPLHNACADVLSDYDLVTPVDPDRACRVCGNPTGACDVPGACQ